MGNKLSSYGGKLRYTVKNVIGNASANEENVPSRKVRSAGEMLSLEALIDKYATDDVRDVEDTDIDIDTDASGTEDPSLDVSENTLSILTTQLTPSRVKETPPILPETNATSKHPISSDDSRNVTENSGAPTAATNSATERTGTKPPPTIDTGNILTTPTVETTPSVEVDGDTDLNILSENEETKRVFRIVSTRSELPATTATRLTKGETVPFQTTRAVSDGLIATSATHTSLTTSNPLPQSRDETTPTVFFSSLSTPEPTSKAIATTPNTYDTTKSALIGSEEAKTTSSTYGSDSPTLEMVTTIPDIAYTTTNLISSRSNLLETFPSEPNAPNNGQDGPPTNVPYSTFSTSTKTRPPETFSTAPSRVTDIREDSTTAAAVPSAHTTTELTDHPLTEMSQTPLPNTDHNSIERATTEYVSVSPHTSGTTMITSSGANQEIINTESVSADITDVPTSRTATKPNTFHSTTPESAVTKSDTTGIISSSQYVFKTASHKIRTLSGEANDSEDVITTAISPSAYSNEQLFSESSPSVTDSSLTKISPDGEDTLTASDLLPASITHSPSTQIPDTSHTRRVSDTSYTLTTSVGDRDETTYIPRSSDYKTDIPSSKTVRSTTDPSFTTTSESTNVQFETSTSMPPLSYSTERSPDVFHLTTKKSTDSPDGPLTADVQVPTTSYNLTGTSTAGKDEATTFTDLSVIRTEMPAAKKEITIAPRTDATSVDGQDETTTAFPSSAYRSSIPPFKTGITGAADEKRNTVPPTTYSSNQVAPEYTKQLPDGTDTTSVDGQDETTTAFPSSAYRSGIPPSKTGITGTVDEERNTVPPTTHSSNQVAPEYTKQIPDRTDTTSVDNQDETTTAFSSSPYGSSIPPLETGITDTVDETSTTVPPTTYSSNRIAPEYTKQVPDRRDTTSVDGQDETTTAFPSSAYSSSIPPSKTGITDTVDKTSTTAPPTTYSSNQVAPEYTKQAPDRTDTTSIEGQNETTTAFPSSAYSSSIPPSQTGITDTVDETSTTVPPTTYISNQIVPEYTKQVPGTSYTERGVPTDSVNVKIMTVVPSSYIREGPTTDSVTTKSSTSYSSTTPVPGEDGTATNVYPTPHSTAGPSSKTTRKKPSTSPSDVVLVDRGDGSTTKLPSSGYSTDTTTLTNEKSTMPDTFYTPTKSSTGQIDGGDEVTTAAPASYHSTDRVTRKTVSAISGESHTKTVVATTSYGKKTDGTGKPTSESVSTLSVASSTGQTSVDGDDGITTEIPPSAYSTVETTPRTDGVVTVDREDILISTVPPSGYSTDTNIMTTVATIPATFHSSMKVPTDQTGTSDERTTTAPSTSRSTETTMAPTTGDETAAYVAEKQTSETLTTLSSVSYASAPPVYGEGETNTGEPSSGYGADGTTTTVAKLPSSRTTATATAEASKTKKIMAIIGNEETTKAVPNVTYSRNSPSFTTVSTITNILQTKSRVLTGTNDFITTSVPSTAYGTSTATTESTSSTATSTREPTSQKTTQDITPSTPVTQPTASPPSMVGKGTEAVRIMGRDGSVIVYHGIQPGSGNDKATIEIKLTEEGWRSTDGVPASRESFMRVLSDVQGIFIRASYDHRRSTLVESVSIKDVSLDVGSQEDAGHGKALLVEKCECAEGYDGLSCEYCSPGYTRTSDGLNCTKCSCNGHSDVCDQENGTCIDCRYNTEGSNCERCRPGYFGNALTGTSTDCKPCPCPLTISPNQFSPTCFLDSDGLPTCDACPVGYSGRNCEM
ncbi:mucin-2-like [Stylophora pistillata]|uniref:mucin-2-like n=1 Tax=Stylophora pistillata TaxID=50429 RepID=UPI000C03D4F4|nr:mucin-2-like [Stylophora pistillata]